MIKELPPTQFLKEEIEKTIFTRNLLRIIVIEENCPSVIKLKQHRVNNPFNSTFIVDHLIKETSVIMIN